MPAYVELLKKYRVKLAFGTDLVEPVIEHENKEFTLRTQYGSRAEILIQATGNSYDAIAMSGELNRYVKAPAIRTAARLRPCAGIAPSLPS